ncbi:hypothetical protein B0H14DRAFT_2649447, partial [Mycena olivaceomarginata]
LERAPVLSLHNKIIFRTPDSLDQKYFAATGVLRKVHFELNELNALALQSLKSQFSADNIVREAFSTFTSLFPEIQDIEVDLFDLSPAELGARDQRDVEEYHLSVRKEGPLLPIPEERRRRGAQGHVRVHDRCDPPVRLDEFRQNRRENAAEREG